jgi:hypothetical protein
MKRLLCLVIICSLCQLKIAAQDIDTSGNDINESGQFFAEISSQAFFDNLEFFNKIQEGYTLTGFNLEPRIAYSVGNKAKFSTGAHMLYFSGQNELARFVPVLTFSARLARNMILNLGTIESVGNHGLPEQLFKAEREFTHKPENGLQIIMNSEHYKTDLWINWESFIQHGDSEQEEFTFGYSSVFKAVGGRGLNLDVPVYLLAVHKGGQINISNERVSTLMNGAGGVNLSYPIYLEKRVGLEFLYFIGRDLSPNPHHIYQKGWAMFPKIYYKSNTILLDAGYWRASEMMLPRGEEIFGSVSTVSSEFNSPKRDLIFSNIAYSTEVVKGFRLAFGGQLYYDIKKPLLDYSFSVVGTFNESFLLGGKRTKTR